MSLQILSRPWLALSAILLSSAASIPAHAQSDYPNRPVKIIVGFAPGGPNDVMARILAAQLTKNLGQQFLVENRAGAGGTVGNDAVAKSPADGYTLLFPSAPFVTAPALYGSKLRYDTLKDLTGIAMVAESPLVLMASPSAPFKSLKDVVAAAKAKPNGIFYGSGGVASTPHLAMSLFEITSGTHFSHVPYKGGAPAIQALVGGEVQLLLDSATNGGSFISAGKLHALAVTGPKRAPKLPDVPTFAEAGMPNYEMTHWVGLAAPSKTPPEVLDKLFNETRKALASDEVKLRLAELGAAPSTTSRKEFNAFLASEVTRWGKIVKEANIQAE
jgi:tripartite-type tricarboxylate transporter receptor subunit TctC